MHARLELSGPSVGLASSAPGFKSSQRLDCGKRTLPPPTRPKKKKENNHPIDNCDPYSAVDLRKRCPL